MTGKNKVGEVTSQRPIPCIIVTFKLSEVFPISSPLSVPLLRLMAATNDVRQLQKLVLAYATENPANEVESLVHEGENVYLIRMFCGHLYEAGNALRHLDRQCKKQVDELIKDDPEGVKLIKNLRAVYSDMSDSGLWKALDKMRNRVSFHYPETAFAESLKEHHADEAKIALVDFSGMGRYSATDTVLKTIAIRALGGSMEHFQRKIGEAISLAGLLAQTVDCLVSALFEKYERAILKTKKETVKVPNFLTAFEKSALRGGYSL
jgi:hypothetical protein